jgi:hypothetical protein
MKGKFEKEIERRLEGKILTFKQSSDVSIRKRITAVFDSGSKYIIIFGRLSSNRLELLTIQAINLAFGNSIIDKQTGMEISIEDAESNPDMFEKTLKAYGYSFKEADSKRRGDFLEDSEEVINDTFLELDDKKELNIEEGIECHKTSNEFFEKDMFEVLGEYESLEQYIFENKESFVELTKDEQLKVILYFKDLEKSLLKEDEKSLKLDDTSSVEKSLEELENSSIMLGQFNNDLNNYLVKMIEKLYPELKAFIDDMTGVIHISKIGDKDLAYACTPFWDNNKGIPIEVYKNDDIAQISSVEVPESIKTMKELWKFYEQKVVRPILKNEIYKKSTERSLEKIGDDQYSFGDYVVYLNKSGKYNVDDPTTGKTILENIELSSCANSINEFELKNSLENQKPEKPSEEYRFFIYNLEKQKITSGWEYASDAFEIVENPNVEKVYSISYLKNKLKVDPFDYKNWSN